MTEELEKLKLYIGSLSYDSTEDSLREAFEKAGTVKSASIIMDRMTGRSKGFGFVEMGSEEEAKKAIEMWDGKELDGRAIRVSEARPMKERTPGQGYDRRDDR